MVSDSGLNLRINADTSATNGAINRAGVPPMVAGGAYTNSFAGSRSTVLAALRTSASGPYTLYTVSLAAGAATLYRNTTGDATRSLIGGSAGPSVRDIAIKH